MKAKYIFTVIAMSFMTAVVNAQNDLVVVKNDGLQLTFSLSKKPYMLFDESNVQIVALDKQVSVNYLDFNYFYYQGQQQERMNTITL